MGFFVIPASGLGFGMPASGGAGSGLSVVMMMECGIGKVLATMKLGGDSEGCTEVVCWYAVVGPKSDVVGRRDDDRINRKWASLRDIGNRWEEMAVAAAD